ncbi:Hypothetical protein NCS54_01370900 [Fusarium falciforme]|uniref:Hypothetical protein n=1 Tax=Fusarium falciforme TaxID=195108 RepID=UPI002301DFB7|nr:Hypothetical protein NCS54_01370900 [Fusarium falciforme]WAO96050.1 Hypothetical protein NCS54_01370900 [Fusarium falciforme]
MCDANPVEISHLTEVIRQVQSLRDDFNSSQRRLESYFRTNQDEMNRIGSCLSQVLQCFQTCTLPRNAFIEESPDSISSDDERDEKPKDENRCPHPDCLGRDKRFQSPSNLYRHYTTHAPFGPSDALPAAPSDQSNPSDALPAAPSGPSDASDALPAAPSYPSDASDALPAAPSDQSNPSDALPAAPSDQSNPSDALPAAPSDQSNPSDALPAAPSDQSNPSDALPADSLPVATHELLPPRGRPDGVPDPSYGLDRAAISNYNMAWEGQMPHELLPPRSRPDGVPDPSYGLDRAAISNYNMAWEGQMPHEPLPSSSRPDGVPDPSYGLDRAAISNYNMAWEGQIPHVNTFSSALDTHEGFTTFIHQTMTAGKTPAMVPAQQPI